MGKWMAGREGRERERKVNCHLWGAKDPNFGVISSSAFYRSVTQRNGKGEKGKISDHHTTKKITCRLRKYGTVNVYKEWLLGFSKSWITGYRLGSPCLEFFGEKKIHISTPRLEWGFSFRTSLLERALYSFKVTIQKIYVKSTLVCVCATVRHDVDETKQIGILWVESVQTISIELLSNSLLKNTAFVRNPGGP